MFWHQASYDMSLRTSSLIMFKVFESCHWDNNFALHSCGSQIFWWVKFFLPSWSQNHWGGCRLSHHPFNNRTAKLIYLKHYSNCKDKGRPFLGQCVFDGCFCFLSQNCCLKLPPSFFGGSFRDAITHLAKIHVCNTDYKKMCLTLPIIWKIVAIRVRRSLCKTDIFHHYLSLCGENDTQLWVLLLYCIMDYKTGLLLLVILWAGEDVPRF